jgi:hypothetical protein
MTTKYDSANLELGLRVGISLRMIWRYRIDIMMMITEIKIPRPVPRPGLSTFYSSTLYIGK